MWEATQARGLASSVPASCSSGTSLTALGHDNMVAGGRQLEFYWKEEPGGHTRRKQSPVQDQSTHESCLVHLSQTGGPMQRTAAPGNVLHHALETLQGDSVWEGD
jgi:hypothetical protein